MNIKFFTRSNANPQNILVRAYHSKQFDQTATTKISVLKGDFSNAYQKVKNKHSVKNKDEINAILNDLRRNVLECYNNTILTKQDFPRNWLKNTVDNFFNRATSKEKHKTYLIDWVDYYIKTEKLNKNTGKPITAGTIRKNKSVLNTLKAFEKHVNKTILLKNIDYNFYKEFVNFCLNVQGYTQNTTGTRVKSLKTWLNESNKRGFSNIDLSDFKTMTNETKDVYLNEYEINRIFNHDFTKNLKLSNARDLLILGVRTGLRVSDFMKLDINNIHGGFIEVKTQKTGTNVVIPIHNQITEIINRNNGSLPRSISDQRFNDYIKEVCKTAGINSITEGGKINPTTKRKEYGRFEKWELITSHTCRRSFASNLYGKIDNGTIMGITGHKTEKEFLKYIKITPRQHAETLKQLFDEQAKTKTTDVIPLRKVK